MPIVVLLPSLKMKRNLSLIVLLLGFGLQACGLKGDLYLEKPEEEDAQSQQQPTDSEAATDAALEGEPDTDVDPLSSEPDADSNQSDADTLGVESGSAPPR